MNYRILLAIQRILHPVLDVIFEAVTLLGEQMLIAGLFCLVYWCWDKRMGRFLILSLSLSVCVTGLVKDAVRAPRPIGQPGIVSRRVETAPGYSFPSGHTMSAANFYGGVALWVKRPWVTELMGLLIVLVGFSRLYLGLHYPVDVLGGMLLGTAVCMLCYALLRRPGSARVLVGLCIVAGVAALLLDGTEDTTEAGGLMFGVLAGLWLELKCVRFERPRGLWPAFRRLFGGVLLVGALYMVPKLTMEPNVWISAARNACIGFVATGGWPWLFVRLEKWAARS